MLKNIKKTIRFNKQELKKIETEIGELNNIKFSEFCRSKILGKNITINKNINIQKIYQLKKIGNNINQIAKRINQKNLENEIEILEVLKKIEDEIIKL